MRLARASVAQREADVQATLGQRWRRRVAAGQAWPILDRALEASRGGPAGRTLMRRATIRCGLGQREDQVAWSTLPLLRRAGDRVSESSR